MNNHGNFKKKSKDRVENDKKKEVQEFEKFVKRFSVL